MSRWSRYDTDEERLPEGMERVGYDADTQVYTFRDADGSYWESAPGCQYGQLTRVGDADHDAEDTEPFLLGEQPPELSWRNEMRPFLHFGMLICLFLLALFYFLHWRARDEDNEPAAATCAVGMSKYVINKGDTCWDIAEGKGISIDDILKNNKGLNCDDLRIGSQICVPTS